MAEEKKRVRRSREALIAELKEKIEKEKKDSKARIKKMEDKIKELENPPKRKLSATQKKKLLAEELLKTYDVQALETVLGKSAEDLAAEKEKSIGKKSNKK